jgi:hypothetical protein
MSGHIDTAERLRKDAEHALRFTADGKAVSVWAEDALALVAENQRLRDALAEIVAMYERGAGRRKTAAMVARAALTGTPSEDT